MGTSTNATVAFGIDLGEELPEAWRKDEEEGGFEWAVLAAADSGVPPPSGDYNGNDPAWPAYWAAQRKAVADFPVTLVTHCSGDYPMYFLAINGTEVTASRGTPVKLDQQVVSRASVEAMQQFCLKHGIDWQEPAWHIFSYWG